MTYSRGLKRRAVLLATVAAVFVLAAVITCTTAQEDTPAEPKQQSTTASSGLVQMLINTSPEKRHRILVLIQEKYPDLVREIIEFVDQTQPDFGKRIKDKVATLMREKYPGSGEVLRDEIIRLIKAEGPQFQNDLWKIINENYPELRERALEMAQSMSEDTYRKELSTLIQEKYQGLLSDVVKRVTSRYPDIVPRLEKKLTETYPNLIPDVAQVIVQELPELSGQLVDMIQKKHPRLVAEVLEILLSPEQEAQDTQTQATGPAPASQ